MNGAGDPDIQGFATDISVDQGQTIHFKVDTDSTDYHLDIYRMGYYGGAGARRVAIGVQPAASLPQNQDPCEEEAGSGLVDCGNWDESASWPVPASAVSGVYFAKLVRDDEPSQGSHILFIVRDDDGHSELLFQTADTTWQAYNRYGGNSLYEGGPGTDPGRAFKVSYNRPLTTRGTTPEDAPFAAEYPMVRWLERNGYDVSYSTGVDTDRRGSELLEHRAFLSVGHDEYWSAAQRENVEAARGAGVNLAFFSGNEAFWKTRWEESIDGSGSDHRTLVSYKETHANAKIDPQSDVWTGTWRDPRFSSSSDGGKPENALTGTIFTVDAGTTAIEVPAADGKMRLWRDTSVASLAPGETATLAAGTLGYEWDEDLDNGFRPAGLAQLSSTTVDVPQKLLDYGSNYAPGTATHHLTLYRAPSGALVFGAGTVQWSWGLDGEHDRGGSTPDPRMQQATANLLADMGAQPSTLQAGLVAPVASTDSDPPTATIAAPAGGAEVESGQPITVSGSADDSSGETAGGRVAGVEVSVDGGATWHPASGRDQWTYAWTPGGTGAVTVMARAVDDSGNLEQPGDEAAVEVVPHTCPCSIWDSSFGAAEDSDAGSIEVGVKFRSDVPGYITALRFYKTPGNTGTHVGHLWTGTGTQLAEAIFSGESASGWQTVSLDTPVAIGANTTYVASYHAPTGRYASLSSYFSLVGVDSAPLHALVDGVDGPNGIYRYGPSGGLFSGGGPESFQSSNYLTDVVFADEVGPDETPPKVIVTSPAAGATGVGAGTAVRATFDEAISQASIDGSSVQLRDGGGALVSAGIAYSSADRRLTVSPEAQLANSTTYTATIKGGPGGVADLAGNPLAADKAWSFTTAPPPPPPPDEGPGGPILVISNAANPFSRYYAEILRAEGLNEFTATDISKVTPAVLDSHDIAILGEGALSGAQAAMLDSWVKAGGNLIAMRPDQDLAGLLGLQATGGGLSNAYLKVDTATAAGAGIVGETIQFHGSADRYSLAGAEAIATLFADAGTATANPALTLRNVGSNGGHAAAFSYDLAKSVVYTRQGNPNWAGEERDGGSPIRSDDLFFGAKPGDAEPDWVDLGKVAIPQADEQQRLLTNLIERMNAKRKPLPRFWFLPRGSKAAVVMTGDDHAHGGTIGRFNQYQDDSPPGCVVANWECVRSTSYIFPETPITDVQAGSYTAAGFEIGLHTVTNCADWTSRAQLESFYSTQLATLSANFPSLPPPATNRTHCIAWSDWASQPKVELMNGVRLDTNYYYWPGPWVGNRPGMFTGSGMPMRFADSDGSMIDVYQAATQMTDESGQAYPFTIDTLLDNALGPNGYYGVFTANMHTDDAESAPSDAVVASAQARGVPVVSARQMLTWLDGRNQSSFGSLAWTGDKLTFTIDPAEGANGLRAMLPITSATGALTGLARGSTPVATTVETIKGIEYAFFDAAAGSYTASYEGGDTTAPAVTVDSLSKAVLGPGGLADLKWHADENGNFSLRLGGSDCTSGTVLDSGAYSTQPAVRTSTLSAVQLAEGANSLRLCVTDATDNVGQVSRSIGKDTIAPDAQIDAKPAALSSSASAEFKFSGSDPAGSGIASFQCRRDSTQAAGWASCSSPLSYPSLADGPHKFEVRAIDQAGNTDPTPASFNWTVDTTAPMVTIDSISKALVGVGDSSDLDWHADENGAFSLRLGGSDCTSGTVLDSGAYSTQPAVDTSTLSAAQLGEGANALGLCVTDAAGNSGQASGAIAMDTIAPETQIDDQPADPSNSVAASFSFSGSDSGSGVDSFECRLDAAAFAPCTSPQPYGALATGAHEFAVRAIDGAGNVDGSPAAFAWSVDTTAPGVAIDSGPSGLTNDPSPTFAFHGDVGVSFECSIDDAVADFGPCAAAGSHTPPDPLLDGSYTFRVRATDGAGNQATATRVFTVDTAIPAAPVLSHAIPAGPANENSPAIAGSAPAGSIVALYEGVGCSGAPVATATAAELEAGIPVTVADDSATEFRATATSAAGNASACSEPLTYVEDSTPPQTQIDSGPTGTTATPNATFAFSSEFGAGFQCRLDAEAFSGCTSPHALSSLADGHHSFEVRAVDAAGNVDASPALRGWTVNTGPATPIVTIDSVSRALLGAGDSAEVRFHANENGDFSLRANGVDCESGALIDSGPYSGPPAVQVVVVSAAQLAEGANTLRLCLTDVATNTDEATTTVVRDTIAPETGIDSQPADPSATPSAGFAFGGSDPGGSGIASFECSLDAAAFAPCVSPQLYSSLADGPHKFEVRAIDAAGNADSTPALHVWTVSAVISTVADNPPPGRGPGLIRFIKAHYSERKGALVLVVQVPGPGRLVARATEELPRQEGARSAAQRIKGVRTIRLNSAFAHRAGRLRLQVKLTPAAQKAIAEDLKLKVKVELSFEAADGTSARKKVTIVVRKAPRIG